MRFEAKSSELFVSISAGRSCQCLQFTLLDIQVHCGKQTVISSWEEVSVFTVFRLADGNPHRVLGYCPSLCQPDWSRTLDG